MSKKINVNVSKEDVLSAMAIVGGFVMAYEGSCFLLPNSSNVDLAQYAIDQYDMLKLHFKYGE